MVGAQIGELKIKPAKLRGVESNGMLCSAKELGLDADASGLLELPADAPVGSPGRIPRPARRQHRDQADPEPRRLLQPARHRLDVAAATRSEVLASPPTPCRQSAP
jgi:phenylalanyl-tRNA synthetase beta chain